MFNNTQVFLVTLKAGQVLEMSRAGLWHLQSRARTQSFGKNKLGQKTHKPGKYDGQVSGYLRKIVVTKNLGNETLISVDFNGF